VLNGLVAFGRVVQHLIVARFFALRAKKRATEKRATMLPQAKKHLVGATA
jgi:hypothetical protein